MKSFKKCIIIVLVLLLLLPALSYRVYWGRNHKVLYEVTSVIIKNYETEKGYTEITVLGYAKNWIDDFKKKEYRLYGPAPRGSIDYKGIECVSDFITVTQRKTNIKIVLKIYPDKINEETLSSTSKSDVETFIKTICFDSINTNGEFTDPQYTLYMADFKDIDIG